MRDRRIRPPETVRNSLSTPLGFFQARQQSVDSTADPEITMSPKRNLFALRRRFGNSVRLWSLALAFVVVGWTSGANAGSLRVGEAAPPFSLQGSDGQTYTLEGILADSDGLVLAWFPKAFTPG